jgi:hypothetical protein
MQGFTPYRWTDLPHLSNPKGAGYQARAFSLCADRESRALMRLNGLLHIACPQLAKADIMAVRGHSGFEPQQT